MNRSPEPATLYGLPPLVRPDARWLILGSFPSTASLAAGQYYAHRQNQFWKILGAILHRPLFAMDYTARQHTVQAAGIALWDVYASCERSGSLDSAIRNPRLNDFANFQASAPALRRVLFNGLTAGKHLKVLAGLGWETCVLPSTSPAHATWNFQRKLAAWRDALTGSP